MLWITLILIIRLRWRRSRSHLAVPRCPLSFSLTELPRWVRQCPVALRYYALLHPLPWAALLNRPFQSGWRTQPTPYTAFVAASLVKLDQQLPYMSHLHRYLVEHPALVWLLGFTEQQLFEASQVVPTARHLTRLLREMPNTQLQLLLTATVHQLQRHLPPEFGTAVSLDTKHILAWVKENNPKTYGKDRFDKTQQPRGDPDCKLGCKRRHNVSPETTTPTQTPLPASTVPHGVNVGEFYWGYASGVVATKVAGWGEFVLAEYTQTFDHADVTYFQPLLTLTEQRLGQRPRFAAFDAAFDAFYVYEYFARDADWRQGFAAVPLTERSTWRQFDADGHPICPAGLSLIPQYNFTCRTTTVEHERTHYVCPLKGIGCPVQHPRVAKGGCTHRIPTSVGARLRHQIDRTSSLYKEIYKQRTATERINAQAKELGIERPYLRNQAAITNQNTLIYILINLRGLHRIQLKS